MKKVLSLVAAGAMLVVSTGIAFAFNPWMPVNTIKQTSFTTSTTTAVSSSGANGQVGGAKQTMVVGGSVSSAKSITAGNVSVGTGNVTQGALTGSTTTAGSSSGANGQLGGGFFSSQSMSVGGSAAHAGSITVSNVSIQ